MTPRQDQIERQDQVEKVARKKALERLRKKTAEKEQAADAKANGLPPPPSSQKYKHKLPKSGPLIAPEKVKVCPRTLFSSMVQSENNQGNIGLEGEGAVTSQEEIAPSSAWERLAGRRQRDDASTQI